MSADCSPITPSSGQARADDGLPAGSVWEGTRVVNGAISQPCKLTVKTRTGTTFTGELEVVFNGTNTYPVTGTAAADGDGKVSFTAGTAPKKKKAAPKKKARKAGRKK